jgi:uncharacterized membrane protein
MSDMGSAPPVPPAPSAPSPSSGDNKILVAIGYLIPIISLVLLLMEPYKDDKFARFHSVQSIGLWVVLIITQVLAVIPILGWIIALLGWLFWLVLAIMALVKALGGEYYQVPIVYGVVKNYIGQ